MYIVDRKARLLLTVCAVDSQEWRLRVVLKELIIFPVEC